MTLLTLETTRPAHGGYCVARIAADAPDGLGGKVAFVEDALPGETVTAEVLQDAKRHVIARAVDVVTASPDRVPHVWPEAEAAGIGGADLGHVAPAAQVRWKEAVIADVLRRIGGARVAEEVGSVPVLSVGDHLAWRSRLRFVVDGEGRLAMRRRHSEEAVAIGGMPLGAPALERLELFGGGWDLAPGAEVRAVAPSASHPVLVTGDGVWRAPGVATGASVRERVRTGGDWHYEVRADGFWQAHVRAPEVLLEQVISRAALSGHERVLELFAGAGLFTVPLADQVPSGHLVTIEGDRRAVESQRQNLKGRPVRSLVRRVEPRALTDLGRFDTVVLDPPRVGAGEAMARRLVDMRPNRIVYVACDPAALARDLKVLAESYAISDVAGYDLFPCTHHVELVATLDRR